MSRYLDRLNVPAEPPSPSALRTLHRAHVEHVPYETFWLHLREGWGISPHESLQRIAIDGRGGYCFHLNAAFAQLLQWLGYHVTLHPAGVHDSSAPTHSTIGNHAAVIVRDLPDDDNTDGAWYLDAGLGEGLHEPLALRPGVSEQGPTSFTIQHADDGHWSMRVHPPDSFTSVSILDRAATIEQFESRHHFNTTSPQSSFARTVTAQRRDATSVDILRGCVFTSRRATGISTHTFDDCADWLTMLDSNYGLRFTTPRQRIDDLWTRVRSAHRDWLANASDQPGET